MCIFLLQKCPILAASLVPALETKHVSVTRWKLHITSANVQLGALGQIVRKLYGRVGSLAQNNLTANFKLRISVIIYGRLASVPCMPRICANYNITLILGNKNSFIHFYHLWSICYTVMYILSVMCNLKMKVKIHSVPKETHHKFIGFPWKPWSRSCDLGRVVFYHENLEQVPKYPIQICQTVLPISWKVQGYVMFWNL